MPPQIPGSWVSFAENPVHINNVNKPDPRDFARIQLYQSRENATEFGASLLYLPYRPDYTRPISTLWIYFPGKTDDKTKRVALRSEERRVGKECRPGWSQ